MSILGVDWEGQRMNAMVEISLILPEGVADQFGATPQAAGRQVLESAAVEGYRSGRLSRGQVREMLGFSWHETEEFLARHRCERHYSRADLEEDRAALETLRRP